MQKSKNEIKDMKEKDCGKKNREEVQFYLQGSPTVM